ncbi:MAG: ChaN family lipoprotein, partial [Desulfobulbaceae bacterium]|nr:ChaN family lipoprotein [Desulfobulbaceae bacterium]
QQNRAVGYAKGAMVFHMLRKQIGDEAFFKGLRDFYQRMQFSTANWDDLRTSFENSSDQKLDTFFDQWLNRADLPELVVKNISIEEENGRPEVHFTLIQKSKKPYHLFVPVLVGINDERTITPVEVTDKETKVSLPFDERPTELVVDPNHDLMRRLSTNEMPPAWSRFEGASKKLVVIANDEAIERFTPLLNWLDEMGCEIKDNSEVTDKDVANGATIFLGASTLSRSLFATPDHPKTGFTIDIRRNPLNTQEVAALVTTNNVNETTAAVRKLRHYGKYSYLHFENGRAVSKTMAEAEHGLAYWLELPPKAITVAKTNTFDDIIKQLLTKQVIYVGEGHTTYEDHLLQLRIIRALHKHDPKLAIGMEMFNRSAQPALDEYLAGTIDETEMLRKTEYFKRWGYDYRNYSDIIRFAHLHKIPLLALNQEREVVSKIFKDSTTSTLSEKQNKLLPTDRDLDVPGYQERIHRVFTMHAAPSPEQFKGFIQAQALWDETMAVTVADYLTANPDQRVVVIAGVGHVAKAEAIPPRVARRINVKQAVVANINSTEADPEQIDYAFLLDPAQLPPAPLLGVMLTEKDDTVLIDKLSPHGMAQKMGIREKDVILALDGQPTKTIGDLKIIMLNKKKGEKVEVTIKRKRAILPDKTLKIEVPL